MFSSCYTTRLADVSVARAN
ncbi:hypothetical protein ACLE1T_003341 [Cronobacter turicensis]